MDTLLSQLRVSSFALVVVIPALLTLSVFNDSGCPHTLEQ
jgi:hypothetical protein